MQKLITLNLISDYAENAFFGVIRAQGTCLMASNIVLSRWEKIRPL